MTAHSSRQRCGFGLGILVGLQNVATVFLLGADDGSADPTGPPVWVVLFGVLTGVLIIGLLVASRIRQSRGLIRAACVLMVLAALSAVPAFGQDSVPAGVKLVAGALVLTTVLAVALLLSRPTEEATA